MDNDEIHLYRYDKEETPEGTITVNDELPPVSAEFRLDGIERCVRTSIHQFKDAQLLCRNNRSSASYLKAIHGLEELGKVLYLRDGVHPLKLSGHEKKLKRLFRDWPLLENLSPNARNEHARWYARDSEAPRFVDVVHQDNAMIWILSTNAEFA